jgi:hypothetical protein
MPGAQSPGMAASMQPLGTIKNKKGHLSNTPPLWKTSRARQPLVDHNRGQLFVTGSSDCCVHGIEERTVHAFDRPKISLSRLLTSVSKTLLFPAFS